MTKPESGTRTPDPKFAHLDHVHPFEPGKDTSQGTIGNKAVEVSKDGQVTGIIGTFTSHTTYGALRR
ncbi:MAG: hypothetical protein WC835_03280 [Candidatus Paceibacterota bacterium]